MDLEKTKEAIKKEEGFRLEVYKCTEGHLTGGYGHKMLDGEETPKDHAGWLVLFERDFARAVTGAYDIHRDTVSPVCLACERTENQKR
jgi:GH24 family phage-related lysozyme (muramidase)